MLSRDRLPFADRDCDDIDGWDQYIKGLTRCRGLHYIPFMSTRPPLLAAIAAALRTARKSHGLSIAALAAQGGVSPRLVSEFEHGRRPHVSLETALRLLQLVNVPVSIAGPQLGGGDEEARAARAALRRRTWVVEKSTLREQKAPHAPTSAAARLTAVAQASHLGVGLQTAPRQAMRREAAEHGVVKRVAKAR